MKKIFTFGFLAFTLLFTGCGNDKPAPENKNTSKQESHQSVSESKSQSPSAEITDEEKARQEAERKAMEEKQRAEAEQRDAKLQAEISQNQARLDSLLNEGVQLNYEIVKIGESKYKVSGVTNLPDGMQIMITLDSRDIVAERLGFSEVTEWTNEQAQMLIKNSYTGQDKTVIKSGKFETVFSGQKLLAGEYDFSISSPDNDLQSKEIQLILGNRGENLFGTGVIEDKYGKRIDFEERVYLQ